VAEKITQKDIGNNKPSAESSSVKKTNLSKFSYRKEEQSSGLYDRSGRFFCRKGSWFFKTREGIDYGPYQSRVECRYAYEEFIDVVSEASHLITHTTEYKGSKSDWELPKVYFS